MRSFRVMRPVAGFVLALFAAAPLACSKDGASFDADDVTGGGGDRPDDQGPFACDGPSPEDGVAPSFAHRLTRRQLERTLRDVLGTFLDEAVVAPMVASAFEASPPPAETERYKRWDNDLSVVHAQSYFNLADTIAKAVASEEHRAAFANAAVALDAGPCTSFDANAPSPECQRQIVRNVGARFLRHPLAEDEVDAYAQELSSGSAATALGNLVFRMLLAPRSLFQMEIDEQPIEGRDDVVRLSSTAIVNRLSFTFWNAPPDEHLRGLATSSDLSADEPFAAALDYVLDHPRFEDSNREFFADWLRLDHVPAFEATESEMFQRYAGGVRFDGALREELLREVEELGNFVSARGGTFRDLFTTEVSFARGAEMMKLYGAEAPAPAVVTPENAVKLPPGTHPGIFTRAAVLATASGTKNPVLRGVRVRRDVLCMPLALPPNLPAEALAPPPFDESLTARERFARKTSSGTCGGCHSTMNPFGDALSNYSGVGRFELAEPAIREDGSYAGKQLSVDARADLSALLGPGAEATNPAQYMELLAERAEAMQCFSKAYAEYQLSRATADGDGCRLNRMFNRIKDGQSLKSVMRSLAMDREFRLRRL